MIMKLKESPNIKTRYAISILVVAFSIVLIIASFICPPRGEIDASVLTALGEFLAFAGSVLGIDTSYEKYKLSIQNDIRANEEQSQA